MRWRPIHAHAPEVLRDFQRAGQAIPRRKVAAVQAGVWSTTSATFVSWNAPSPLTVTFDKASDDTLLVARMDLTFFVSATTSLSLAIDIDGTQYQATSFSNEGSSHKFRSFAVAAPSLLAGSHTITAKIAVAGAITLSTDANDYGVLDVMEVLGE